jgi:hypothetical protein
MHIIPKLLIGEHDASDIFYKILFTTPCSRA